MCELLLLMAALLLVLALAAMVPVVRIWLALRERDRLVFLYCFFCC